MQFGAKIKTSSDLMEMCEYTSQFEGAEYTSDKSIIRLFIQNLNLGKLFPKLKSYWIYLSICTRANFKVAKTNMTAMY